MARGNKPGVRLVKQYHVFKDGTVWAEYKNRCTLVKGWKTSKGYRGYNIYGRSVEGHILVAEEFLGPKPGPEYQVDHINRVRDDNRVENLRWATRAENCENRIFGGTLEQAIAFVRANGYSVKPI